MIDRDIIPREKLPITRKGEPQTFKPFLWVSIKSGEVMLDRRDEFCPSFSKR